MSNEVWRPQPRQEIFMSRGEDEALYGGAAGGGKSDALVIEATRQIDIPHYKGLILRKTYPQLAELIDKSLNYYSRAFPGAVYNASKHSWRFPSGAKIIFGSLNSSQDKYNYQGQAYDFIAFDELTHFSFDEYIYLLSRNRPNGPGTRCYVRATANPGGIGHIWVKDRFITAAAPMTTVWETVPIIFPDGHTETKKRSRIFIPSTVFDNKKLLDNDPNYLARLGAMPEAERKALLYGDWDSYSGQYFSEWKNDSAHYKDRQWSHVIDPFDIPRSWPIYRALDWGFHRPYACLYFTVDEDGRLYCIAEDYGCTGTPNEGVRLTPQQVFSDMARYEKEHPWFKGRVITGVADPACWGTQTGVSVAEAASNEGIYFTPGDNARIPGWLQVHYRLSFDSDGYPMMYVFKGCKNLIRTLPSLIYDDRKVEDLNTDGEDHCLTGDTLVLTDGGYKQLASLVGTTGKVMSHDGKYHGYHDVRLTRRQANVYAVELEDGTKIHCTDDHRFMLPSGEWIHAKDLTAGTELKSYESTDYQQYGAKI